MSPAWNARVVSPEHLRRYLVHHSGMACETPGATAMEVLDAHGMIQLDPIDRYGTSPDLMVHARTTDHRRGQTIAQLQPRRSFEHYAKELCLLPARLFPHYRALLDAEPTYRQGRRLLSLPPGLLDAVEAEIVERGPLSNHEFTDRGAAEPANWSGWKGTNKQSSLAIRALWLQGRIVPVGRTGRSKIWDVPSRALPPESQVAAPPDWRRALFVHRIRAAVLLPTSAGPWWGGLKADRDRLIAELIEEGTIQAVRLAERRRTWLCLRDPEDLAEPTYDDRMRVVAPLDPMIWDRLLIERAFGFRYVWEIYKPKDKREWGYYVCPLLHRGQLVGRFEAHREAGRLVVDRLWKEAPTFDIQAWTQCLGRLEAFQ